ncbi:MAG: hypothetical protein KF681_18490 [Bdellovibrionaceae bacterium]|nr:hypothetical protein [Pseudobdellovibrionaceae bacterium]
MKNQTNIEDSGQYFRFQVYQGEQDSSGKIKKTKSVGMAYLKDGQNIFSLRLWMFSWDRYYNRYIEGHFEYIITEPTRWNAQ